jgi:hypothetical protein
MKREPFEIVFHNMGNRAKVINFRNFLSYPDMLDKYGGQIAVKFYTSGRNCFYSLNPPASIVFIRPIDEKSIVQFTETEFGRTVWGNRVNEIGGMNHIYLQMGQILSPDEIKQVKQFVAEANEHLDKIIDSYERTHGWER